MCCCHRNRPHRSYRSYRAYAADDRGAAALEGVIIAAFFGGALLASLLLVKWGTGIQSGHMGARLLAFNAGDTTLAKLNVSSNTPKQQFTTVSWDTLVPGVNAAWLHNMYTLSNGDFSGSVTGTANGRLPGQQGMFNYSSATIGYCASGWATASDPWGMPESLVQSDFVRIAYRVGLTRVSPSGLDSTYARPIPHGDTVLQTIYRLVGQ